MLSDLVRGLIDGFLSFDCFLIIFPYNLLSKAVNTLPPPMLAHR